MIKCFCSGPFMNDGRCLKKKWSSPGIMNAITFTRVEIHIIDMTWNLSGYEKILYWVCNIWYLSPLILLPNYVFFFLNCLPGEKKGFLAAFYCYQAPKGIYSKAFTWCRWSYFSGDKDGFLNFLHNSSIGDFFVLNTFSICFLILWSYEWSNKYHLHTTPKNPVYIAPLTYHTVKDLSCVRWFL
jgi:hypothetical protein